MLLRIWSHGLMCRVCLLGTLLCTPLWAQVTVPAAGTPVARPAAPRDALGRVSPRGAVLGFLSAAGKGNMEVAAQYLNTRLRGKGAEHLAQELFAVLDRRLPARLLNLSDSPEGSLATPKAGQDLVGTVSGAEGDVDILVEVVALPQGPRWVFAKETLDQIPELFQELNEIPINSFVPESLLTTRFAGILLFQWLFTFVGLPVLYFLTALLNWFLGLLIGSLRRRVLKEPTASNPEVLAVPVRLLLIVLFIRAMLFKVALPLFARQFWSTTATLTTIVACLWLCIITNKQIERHIRRRMARAGNIGASSIVRLGRGVTDVLLIFVGFLATLYLFGINPTTALAGLGIGGIAIALAAQKTLENVLGGVSLIFDRVVQVAETLNIGGMIGTVEEVGWRSTSIRTRDRSVVSIPNGQLANLSLESLSSKDKFWFNPSVRLRYDATAAQTRSILKGLDSLLTNCPRIESNTNYVLLKQFGTSSLELEVFAYVLTRDSLEYLRIQEELLLRFMEIVEAAGAHIALQSPVYVASTSVPQSEKLKSMRPDDSELQPPTNSKQEDAMIREVRENGAPSSGRDR
jgi:MscS family membrane protein